MQHTPDLHRCVARIEEKMAMLDGPRVWSIIRQCTPIHIKGRARGRGELT